MHPFRRRIVIVALAAGAILGFGSEFHHAQCCRRNRQEAWERHVARVCIDAARDPRSGRDNAAPGGW